MHGNHADHSSNAQPNAARSSFWIECEGMGYDDQTSPPTFGNRHRYSATRLAFSRLLCGSQPTTPHPLQAARNRANLLSRIWFQVSRDLHERLDTGPFLTGVLHRDVLQLANRRQYL